MRSFHPLVQEIETPRLRMRPWRQSDSGSVRALWAERNPLSIRVIDADGDGDPTIDEIRVNIEKQLEESVRTGLALLAIETQVDGEFIGYCGLIVGRASLVEPEIAYGLVPPRTRSRKPTEAAQAVLPAALNTGRTRFWATVRSWNTASFRVLKKIGCVDSGRLDTDPDRGDLAWMTWPAP